MFKDLEINVVWSKEDNEWVGTCNKYPSLSYLSEDIEETLLGIIELAIETTKEVIHEIAKNAWHESLEKEQGNPKRFDDSYRQYEKAYLRLIDN